MSTTPFFSSNPEIDNQQRHSLHPKPDFHLPHHATPHEEHHHACLQSYSCLLHHCIRYGFHFSDHSSLCLIKVKYYYQHMYLEIHHQQHYQQLSFLVHGSPFIESSYSDSYRESSCFRAVSRQL
ncbi:hypothetical protein ACOSQ3_003123 [Xanthoceras sorbifolium]